MGDWRNRSLLALGCCAAWGALAQTAPVPVFHLKEIQLDGASLLTEAQWRPDLVPLLGQDISFAQLEAARAAVEARFHAAGWRLVRVQVPAQAITDGVVRFVVVEPRTASVKVQGVQGEAVEDPQAWLRALPALREGSPPNLGDLDRQLSLLNENPARRAQVAFSLDPDGRNVATDIQAQAAPPDAWVAFLDNSGNNATGKLRYGLAWRHANLFDRDHQINLQVISAPHAPGHPSRFTLLPNHRVQIYGLGYRVPLYAHSAMLDFTLGYSNVDSGTLQDLFKVTGRGTTAAFRYTQLMRRHSGWEPRWHVGLDLRHYDSQLVFGGVNLGTPLTVRPLSVGLMASRPATPQQPLAASVSASVAVNLPGGAHGNAATFAATRPGARARYAVWRGGASLAVKPSAWSYSASLDAQYSRDLLVPAEQFSAGGAGSVRGFTDRGISGDRGVRIQLEALSSNLMANQSSPHSIQLSFFTDAAWARTNQAAALAQTNASIASVGVGLRGALGPVTWRLDLARPVHQRTGAGRVSGAAHFSTAIGF